MLLVFTFPFLLFTFLFSLSTCYYLRIYVPRLNFVFDQKRKIEAGGLSTTTESESTDIGAQCGRYHWTAITMKISITIYAELTDKFNLPKMRKEAY